MLKMVAAIDRQGGLGKDNRLLYQIDEDMKRFKALTLGHPVIMGFNTYQSIGKPLPGRENLVLTRSPREIDGVRVLHSREEVLAYLEDRDAYVIGGEQIFRLFWEDADELYLTIITQGEKEADAFFPDVSREEFEEVECIPSSQGNPCLFMRYVRRQAAAGRSDDRK